MQAGDAVFIPEGWWHQIDSTDITIAVNFWWQSPFGAGLQVLPCLVATPSAVVAEFATIRHRAVGPNQQSRLPSMKVHMLLHGRCAMPCVSQPALWDNRRQRALCT